MWDAARRARSPWAVPHRHNQHQPTVTQSTRADLPRAVATAKARSAVVRFGCAGAGNRWLTLVVGFQLTRTVALGRGALSQPTTTRLGRSQAALHRWMCCLLSVSGGGAVYVAMAVGAVHALGGRARREPSPARCQSIVRETIPTRDEPTRDELPRRAARRRHAALPALSRRSRRCGCWMLAVGWRRRLHHGARPAWCALAARAGAWHVNTDLCEQLVQWNV